MGHIIKWISPLLIIYVFFNLFMFLFLQIEET